MFRFATLAILIMSVLVVLAGPVPFTCTEKTEPNGDVTVTCRDIGVVVTWTDRTKTVLKDWSEVPNLRGFYIDVRGGNTYTYTRKANAVTQNCTEKAEPNGDVTVTCRDIGIIVRWADNTETVLYNWADLCRGYIRGYAGIRSGNSYTYTRKASDN